MSNAVNYIRAKFSNLDSGSGVNAIQEWLTIVENEQDDLVVSREYVK